MAGGAKKKYKFVKGDTLGSIAKKHKIRDWKEIWNAPENKEVVSKRKKPEQIQPGDVLVLPPGEVERKENAKKLGDLNIARDKNLEVRQGLEAETERLKRKIKIMDDLIQDSRESAKKIVEELDKDLKGMKKWGQGVDAAALIAQMGVSLGKIGSMGYKASKASGEALKRLNEEALKEASQLAKDPVKDGSIKAVATLKDNASKPMAALGIVAESWEKMTSPSFWAHTYVQIVQNKKGWSEAVSMEIGQDIEDRMKQVVSTASKHIKTLQDQKAQFQAQLAALQPLMNECDDRAKFNESEAMKLH